MFPDLVRFIHISTQSQFTAFQRKANAIIGPVNIPAPARVAGVVDALKSRFGLNTNQVVFAQKLAYASILRHYKYNTTMLEDVLNGHRRRYSSYK